MKRTTLRNDIFTIPDEASFIAHAIEVFRHQYEHNSVYQKFVDGFKIDPQSVKTLHEIPFLPVEFFKSHEIKTGEFKEEEIFTSSGTTGDATSRHIVRDLKVYEESFIKSFELFYGQPKDFVFLALLPSYLERKGSSLIYMMDELIRLSADGRSGFFLNEHEQLHSLMLQLQNEKKKVVLIGVTYALLDFAESFKINFPELIVMETGGMKGKRKEMIRAEVHGLLKPAFGVNNIHSEYGMTELLSQAYSKGEGVFVCPPWMRILVRDMYDPRMYSPSGATGGINVIDLANIDSCSFLATQDLGKSYDDHSFEILGRFDASDVRGCNLMVE